MRFGPTEFTIVIILCGYVAFPAAFIVVGVLIYRRMKRIEERLRALEERINRSQ